MKNLEQATKNICYENEIKPARSRGQSFLIEEKIYSDMISVADLSKQDKVLEVGPGLGFLTEELINQAEEVAAVELDRKLFSFLEKKFSGTKNLNLIRQDILNLNFKDLFSNQEKSKQGSYKIVANLPYNISSIFLRKFLTQIKRPELMVLMLQKEVAERIVSDPPESVLSVMVRLYSEPEIVNLVSRNSFWPKPRVDSAIVKLKIKPKKIFSKKQEEKFFQLVKLGFSSRRKMLKNNLAKGFLIEPGQIEKKLINLKLNPKVRAQELSLKNWFSLLEEFL